MVGAVLFDGNLQAMFIGLQGDKRPPAIASAPGPESRFARRGADECPWSRALWRPIQALEGASYGKF